MVSHLSIWKYQPPRYPKRTLSLPFSSGVQPPWIHFLNVFGIPALLSTCSGTVQVLQSSARFLQHPPNSLFLFSSPVAFQSVLHIWSRIFKNVNQVIHLCCLNLVSPLIFSRWCFQSPLGHSFCLDFKPSWFATFSSPRPFVDCYYSLSYFHSLPSSPKLSRSHFAPVLQV